ncbi:4Fe-4S binding protein [Candidatus Riflebacteria bacterium]
MNFDFGKMPSFENSGKKNSLSGLTAISVLESAISEGLHFPLPVSGNRVNLFGRNILVDPGNFSDTSFTAGLSFTGLRSAAFIRGGELNRLVTELCAAVSNRLSFVLHWSDFYPRSGFFPAAMGQKTFNALSNTGALQFFAASVQQAVDLTLIAHKVAELSLTPAVLGMDTSDVAFSIQDLDFPEIEQLLQFLGNPDDSIECPTPSQEIIFGKSRRRIPNWFNFDTPCLVGAEKNPADLSSQHLAQRLYFTEHLQEITARVFTEYNSLTGRAYSPCISHFTNDADFVLLCMGSMIKKLLPVVEKLRAKGVKIGCIQLLMYRPFPVEEILKLLPGKKGVTVFEPIEQESAGAAPLFSALASTILNAKKSPRIYSARYPASGLLKPEGTLQSAIENMLEKGAGQQEFFIGQDLDRKSSSFPKQEVLLQTVQREYPRLPGCGIKESLLLPLPPERTLTTCFSVGTGILSFIAGLESFYPIIKDIFSLHINGQLFPCNQTKNFSYLLNLAPEPEPAPPDISQLKIFFTTLSELLSGKEIISRLCEGGKLVILHAENGEKGSENFAVLPQHIITEIQSRKAELFFLSCGSEIAEQEEYRLTLFFGCLLYFINSSSGFSHAKEKLLEKIDNAFDNHPGKPWSKPRQKEMLLGTLDKIQKLDKLPEPPAGRLETKDPEPQLLIREFSDKGPVFSRLSSFNDRIAGFLGDFKREELFTDPFAAIPILPALSAALQDYGIFGLKLPDFFPLKCSGCGECFLRCPHSAIPPVVIHILEILKTGMELAKAQGKQVGQLTPVLKNLGKIANQQIQEKAKEICKVNDFLPQAFDKLARQMKLKGGRFEKLSAEFKEVLAEIKDFPVSVTEHFFIKKEEKQGGTGELFSLTLNPHTCTGCGICSSVCPENAMPMLLKRADKVSWFNSLYKVFEQLPDTSSETVAAAVENKNYNSLAAILLSRNNYFTQAGGGLLDSSPFEKVLLHLTTAVTNAHLKPQVQQMLEEIEELIEKVSEKVHSELSQALPEEDLSALSRVVSRESKQKISFEALVNKMGKEQQLKALQIPQLQRQCELVQSLKDLYWLLAEGPSGKGRSAFGLAINSSPTLSWAKSFPDNPFSCPVVCQWDNDAPMMAVALFKGYLRHFLDNIRVVRRARLESSGEYQPDIHDREIASLDLHALNEKERALLPPLILVGDRISLNQKNMGSISELLSMELPIKILIFDSQVDDSALSPEVLARANSKVALMGLCHQQAFVLQSGTYAPEHLYKGLSEGMSFQGPALFFLYAPDSERHGFPQARQQQIEDLAFYSRTFPAICFNPEKGDFFGDYIDLLANPEPKKAIAAKEMISDTGGAKKGKKLAITFADWAVTQARFKGHFNEIIEEKEGMLPLSDYLCLPEDKKKSCQPFIIIEKQAKTGRFLPSAEIVAASETVYSTWKILQEIAGVQSPFVDRIRDKIQKEESVKKDEALRQLKLQYESEIKKIESEKSTRSVLKLREKLMTLSGFGSNASGPPRSNG